MWLLFALVYKSCAGSPEWPESPWATTTRCPSGMIPQSRATLTAVSMLSPTDTHRPSITHSKVKKPDRNSSNQTSQHNFIPTNMQRCPATIMKQQQKLTEGHSTKPHLWTSHKLFNISESFQWQMFHSKTHTMNTKSLWHFIRLQLQPWKELHKH